MDTPGLHILLVSNLPVGAVRTSAAVPLTQRLGPNAVLFLLAPGTAVTVASASHSDADIAFDLAGGGVVPAATADNSSSGNGSAFRVWCPLGMAAAGYLGNAAAAPLPVETEGRRCILTRGQGLPITAATVHIPIHGSEEGGPLLGRYFVSPRMPCATLAEAHQVVDLMPPPPPPPPPKGEDEAEEEEDQDTDMQDAGEDEEETDETRWQRPCHERHHAHHHRQRQHGKENAEPERTRKRRPAAAAAPCAARRERATSGGSPRKGPKGRGRRRRRRPESDNGDDDNESINDTERENTAAADADADEGETDESTGGDDDQAEPTPRTGGGGAFGGGGGGGGGGGDAMSAWLGTLRKGIRLKGSVEIIPLTANDE